MATDVVMPQMGESIAEGTVVRWIKKVGDKVERDEPLLEISTDKVDAEIPSPASGVLVEILAEEGKTVAVNSVVARLSSSGEAAAPPSAAPPAAPQQTAPAVAVPQEPVRESPEQARPGSAVAEATQSSPAAPTPEVPTEDRSQPALKPSSDSAGEEETEGIMSLDERRRTRSSPLVRKIASENQVDITQISGSGVSGRVTKNDILQYLEQPKAPAPATSHASPSSQPPSARGGSENVEIVPLTNMRKRIADHMVQSKRTSAHVTTVFEVDFTAVERLRKKHKEQYAERGAKLTYLPFIVQAVITAIREFPVLNASMDAENVTYRKEINVGIAVALEWGLIVPVLKRADEKNILGLTRAINDLGERARTKKLAPDDVQGGTFTITNPGIYGGLFGTPIINQPQVAILGVGGVKKRPVVIETAEGDAIVIRSMAYLALTFDHRLIDGAVADQFMARVKSLLEKAQFAL